MKKQLIQLLIFTCLINLNLIAGPGDTTVVQTLTFDSVGRNYMFNFPIDTGQTYEKILMQYTMRCKDGLVSTQAAPNDNGCGEWDYSCNTYITDSSYTDSLKATAPSHVITGFSGTTFDYTTQPTFTYYSYNQQNVVYNSTTSETTANIGVGTVLMANPFGTSGKVSKSQYLFTSTELTLAGLTAGDITSIKLDVNTATTEAKFLRIRMKNTLADTLNASYPELTGFTEVYFLNTTLVNGINDFLFYNNFTWDGTSNVLLEISYTNDAGGTDNVIVGHDAGAKMGLLSITNDYCLNFSGNSRVMLGASNFSAISDEITISLWCYGNSNIMPANSYAFEGKDNLNRRQVNAHLPWSNSRVYWDCGNDGSYDRIDKLFTENDFEGKWNYWTFTKNTNTGRMKMYLNGVICYSILGKNKLIDLQNLSLGSSENFTGYYYGMLDNFRVWDIELSPTEIAEYMHKDVTPSHPSYANLVANYNLNEGSGTSTFDQSAAGETGLIEGTPAWRTIRGRDLFKSFVETTERPNVTFVQGVYNQTTTTINIIDSVENSPNIVYSYTVIGTDLIPVDTNSYYQSGYYYVYDDITGNIVDSVLFVTENTINISTLNYYAKYPSRFEIMSFVTPYGLYLDLGIDGKTWQFDVSDFNPILEGTKQLWMGNGGQNQEDIDIRFLFIEGTPPRDVMNIQQIWRAGSGRSYTNIIANNVTEPRNIILDPAASMYKLKSSITGHGQEGEFIPRTHYLNINGGANEMQWSVWKECADNPIYPQGGTWIYDRAGWCPGAATDMKEFDFSDIVTSGDTIEIDYGVTAGSGTSNYLVNNQLVTYGAINFTLDAAMIEIISPSMRIEYGRVNPICGSPVIEIKNTGSNELIGLHIDYGLEGSLDYSFDWTGSLEFLETKQIVLPPVSWDYFQADSNRFQVTISNPNGGNDEYAYNNTMFTNFVATDVYYTNGVIVAFRTNNAAHENHYELTDVYGNLIYSKGGLSNSITYIDTIILSPGCYDLTLYDNDDDGISWWANNDGAGWLKMNKLEGGTVMQFQADFGKQISHKFSIDNITNIKQVKNGLVNIYPNPTNDILNVNIQISGKDNVNIKLFDTYGRLIYSEETNVHGAKHIKINMSNYSKGMYFIVVNGSCINQTNKIVVE